MNTRAVPARRTADNLEFSHVKSGRCTAYGVVCDDLGNKFDIEIKGTDLKEVRKFIRYEVKQAKLGKGIKVQVAPSEGIPPAVPAKPPKKPHPQGKWHGLSLKIREKRVDIPKPYKLHVEVDPPVYVGVPQDYSFDNQATADLLVNVSLGTVQVELFEFVDPLKTITAPVTLRTDNPIVNASNTQSCTISRDNSPMTFNCPSRYTHDWNVRVSAVDDKARFTIAFDIIVT